jgi:hypothetical protein
MKKYRLFLAALILGASGWASASVPVIELVDAVDAVDADFDALPPLNRNVLAIVSEPDATAGDDGLRARDRERSPVADSAFGVLSEMLKQVEKSSALTHQKVSEGSFSSYAGVPSAASAWDLAPAADGAPALHLVAAPSTPKIWAILLLLLGCVMYQARPRQRSFGANKLV